MKTFLKKLGVELVAILVAFSLVLAWATSYELLFKTPLSVGTIILGIVFFCNRIVYFLSYE